MGEAFAWIGYIVEWIGRFFPRWQILNPTEGGVKFVGYMLPVRFRAYWGRVLRTGHYDGPMRMEVLGAGIHWFWPATTEFQFYPVVRQADNLPAQTIVTMDGRNIAVGGMMVYEVTDLGKLISTTHSAVKLIQDVSLTAIHDVCCDMTWENLVTEQRKGTLNTKLRRAAHKQLEEYGINVIKCMLTDLAPTRVYRVINSNQADSE